MAINLQKGQQNNINATKFAIGLGWATNNSSMDTAFDLDIAIFVLSEKNKMTI
jgi:tellurium resistance protein TerD